MLKALACCLTLLAMAIGGPADAQPSANGTHSTDQHDVTLSGSNYEEVVVGMAKLPKLAGSSGQALLTAMETWVSSQFDLPAIHEHPRIEFAPPAKIASLRFTDLLSDPGARVEPNNRASSAQHDTIAVYDDAARTIYLPEGLRARCILSFCKDHVLLLRKNRSAILRHQTQGGARAGRHFLRWRRSVAEKDHSHGRAKHVGG
jgi:hypothetical protein